MNQYQKDRLIGLLWESLPRVSGLPDRRQTEWGDKTKTGLIACVERILREDGERPEPEVIHTGCKLCGLDIEGFKPFHFGSWRDRGNNLACPSGEVLHEPLL